MSKHAEMRRERNTKSSMTIRNRVNKEFRARCNEESKMRIASTVTVAKMVMEGLPLLRWWVEPA